MNKASHSESDNNKQSAKANGDLASEARVQIAKIKRAGMSISDEVGTFVKEKPLAAVGIALGTGFVLGSVLGTRLGRIALVAAGGYAAQEILEGVLGKGGVRKLLVSEISKLAEQGEKAS